MKSKSIELQRMTIPEDYCDCRFFSFRILFSCYGLFPDEEDMLGVGEGLSFSMMNVSTLSTPVYCPVGRNMHFEVAYGEKAGICIKTNYFVNGSVEDLICQVKRKIDAGNPIVANVDRYYLEYLSIQRAHVGYHSILIFGYDDEKKTIQLFDGLTGSRAVELSYGAFHKAVLSNCIIPTNKIWYCIERSQTAFDKEIEEKTVVASIRRTCQRVLTEMESARRFVVAMKNCDVAQSGTNPQIRKFLDIQSNIFFPSFFEQDRYHSFYRKTFLSFLKKHIRLFTALCQKKIIDAGDELLEAIQTVYTASRRDVAQGLYAFDAYIEKEQIMHQLLLSELNEEMGRRK